MDSKKVKQVKNAFECCSNREIYNCTSCPYRNVSSDCQDNLIYDMGVYINELEKENAEQLKQFAERLKEKATWSFIMCGDHKAGAKTVILHDIDETLKEFINV